MSPDARGITGFYCICSYSGIHKWAKFSALWLFCKQDVLLILFALYRACTDTLTAAFSFVAYIFN
jgi:hypothetical protein